MLVKLWAAVCSVFGWRCRCPRCGAKMEREPAIEESYVRPWRTRERRISITQSASMRIRLTPVYDICTRCDHRIRRRDIRTVGG